MKFAGALLSAGLFLAAAALPAGAVEFRVHPVAVMELFTSQGCSSCPPADAMLAAAAKRKDIVALSYHVDYWDYIGWPDSFGSPEWSDLQRSYAKSWGSGRVYTPQLIVNGVAGVVGSRQNEIDQAMGASKLDLPVMISQDGDVLDVSIDGKAGLPDAIVWLVTFRDRGEVMIERGENQGKTISYSQIVTGRQVLAMWEAGSGAHFKLPLGEVLSGDSNGGAIHVQEEKHGLPGAILGAAAFQL
jgi:hypothetical protein